MLKLKYMSDKDKIRYNTDRIFKLIKKNCL